MVARQLMLLLAALGAAATGSGCSGGAAGTATASDPVVEQDTGVPIEVGAVTRGSIARTLRLTGTLEADRSASVIARVEGLVKSVDVEVGDKVAEHTPLATIEMDDVAIDLREAEGLVAQSKHLVRERQVALEEARSRVAKAKGEEDRARVDRERQETLWARNLIPEDTVERARLEAESRLHDVKTAELAVQRAEIDLELEKARGGNQEAALDRLRLREARHTLTSPIDGVVTLASVEPHDRVMTGQVVFRIMALETLVLRLKVPEASIHLLEREPRASAGDAVPPGNGASAAQPERGLYPATITAESRPGARFQGHVRLISPVVDPASGTVDVEIAIARHGSADVVALAPGMFANCAIEVEQHTDVLLVPKRALIYDEGMPVVFLVGEDNRAQRVPLRGRVGLDDEWNLEVDHPKLHEGDRVIVIGQNNLKDGSRVSIIDPAK